MLFDYRIPHIDWQNNLAEYWENEFIFCFCRPNPIGMTFKDNIIILYIDNIINIAIKYKISKYLNKQWKTNSRLEVQYIHLYSVDLNKNITLSSIMFIFSRAASHRKPSIKFGYLFVVSP